MPASSSVYIRSTFMWITPNNQCGRCYLQVYVASWQTAGACCIGMLSLQRHMAQLTYGVLSYSQLAMFIFLIESLALNERVFALAPSATPSSPDPSLPLSTTRHINLLSNKWGLLGRSLADCRQVITRPNHHSPNKYDWLY